MEEQEIMEAEQPQEQAAQNEQRSYEQEVRELYAARPELRGRELPEEVVQDCVNGKPLTEAYSAYAGRQRSRAEAEARVRQQNARAAAQAPVRGISQGGGVSSQPEDAFLRGFNDVW